MNLFSLEGKNALVIGGSRGIGKAMAIALASAGANVAISSRKQESLNLSVKEISNSTISKIIGIATDITNVDSVNHLIDNVVNEFGNIDILVNSAGVNVRKPALDFSEEDWDTVQDVQLKYVFFTCQAVARHMVENGIKGKIINLGSLSSLLGFPNFISYCAAKGGIMQMTRALAIELAQYEICVNAIAPGYTKTEMTMPVFNDPVRIKEILTRIPMQRTAVPEDYMGVALFLASHASDYMTGQLLVVDGGWTAA